MPEDQEDEWQGSLAASSPQQSNSMVVECGQQCMGRGGGPGVVGGGMWVLMLSLREAVGVTGHGDCLQRELASLREKAGHLGGCLWVTPLLKSVEVPGPGHLWVTSLEERVGVAGPGGWLVMSHGPELDEVGQAVEYEWVLV